MLKKILVAIGLGILPPSAALALPYFRPFKPSAPTPVLGALIDPKSPGLTEATTLLPLITHSPRDGCLLPSLICEDWTPLTIGAGMNAGKIRFVVAPLFNVLPWVVALADAAMPPGWTASVGWLKDGGQKVTFSSGPAGEYQQETNKGYFRVFTGLALHF